MPANSRLHSRAAAPILLGFLTIAGCQDAARPAPTEGAAQVTITYVCGNGFELRNHSSLSTTVHYTVLGTPENGELTLPAASPHSPSTTWLTTLERGSLQISAPDEPGQPVSNGGAACLPPAAAVEPQATLGEWTAPFPWPTVAVHLHLLPDGRVLSWGRAGAPQIYDPSTGSFHEVPSSTMVFCSGHTFLPDGRLLVAGGHLDDRRGLPDANIFDPATRVWSPIPNMRFARWYPTSTTLADGEVLTLGGTDERGDQVATPEVWTGSAWRSLSAASRSLPYYPRTFVAPNGLVFYAGELQQTSYLDPAGQGRWIPVAYSHYGRRDYGSAVMYGPGKVLIVGGSDPPDGQPTSTAEIIDLNDQVPGWRYTEPMHHARRQFNATLLPDGQVLVTGGTSSGGFSDPSGAVHAAELWNPGTKRWSELGANQVNRVYHSTTLLLPDGRVLHSGSGDGPGLPRELNAEIYSPPYLFWGPRPVLEEAPNRIGYEQPFFIATPNAGRVVRVTLVRLPSVTHAFDQSQRFVELAFQRVAGGLKVTAPLSGRIAPPGPYLLSILNDTGVPATSKIIQLS